MNEDKIIQKLLDIEEKISHLASNERIDKFEAHVLDILDKQTIILQRLDQEHLFTLERIKRIEEDVEKLKKHLQLV